MSLIFLYLMLACPCLAVVFNCILTAQPLFAARCAGYCIGSGFLIGLGLLISLSSSQNPTLYPWISLNTLSLLLSSLVLWVSFIVHGFSLRYMHGDRHYRRFFLLLSALTLTVLLMVLSDHLFLLWGAWSLSNFFLVLLMVHKKEWLASKKSGLLAFYTLLSGSICLLLAFVLLSVSESTTSIGVLIQKSNAAYPSLRFLSMSFLLVAALTQCGLFPFHRWLISSLNSPTPISALMHAGLVNGGGIILVKFSPLIILYPRLLTVLFLVGALSAFLGTLWKLMQHDIKKMLACSTMAQMGFMMMQCGAGLFAAAIAHLCWHGLFKANLFLSSGSAITQKKSEANSSKASFMRLVSSCAGGVVAMSGFAFITNKPLALFEASAFVLFFVFIAGTQLMLTWIRTQQTVLSVVLGLMLALFSGLIYGFSIHLIECLIPSISTIKAPQLSGVHWMVMMLFGAFWVSFNMDLYTRISQSTLGCWLYMYLFNASQPSAKTVTALRNDYNY